LIVDDEPDICSVIKLVLEDNGLAVDSFEDPVLALSNFKPGSYDLLILDIKMPFMNGFELYQKIRDIDDQVKVCFLTAGEMYYQKFRAGMPCAMGEEVFLSKPIENSELLDKIKKLLQLPKTML
jgi:DNA-binding response OmpR family regulator